MPESQPGTVLGKYKLLKLLGRGGMGEVWLAEHLKLHGQVAIKILAAEVAQDPEMVERFLREARAAFSIYHPNIIRIHDVGSLDQLHYFAMDYVPGKTLAQLIHYQGPLPPSQVVKLSCQVLSALQAAHQAGVVHRDLKPDNIILDHTGNAVVTDFGIAKVAAMAALTRAGVFVGTPQYVSPEQVQCRPVDARSDLYSWGVVMYEMATGQIPFQGPDTKSILYKHLHDTPRPPAQLQGSVPPELERVILRALAKDPAQRYQSAQEMLEDLEARDMALPPAPQPEPTRVSPPATQILAQTPPRSSRVWLGALLAALLALGGGGLWWWSARQSAPAPVATKAPASAPLAIPAPPSPTATEPQAAPSARGPQAATSATAPQAALTDSSPTSRQEAATVPSKPAPETAHTAPSSAPQSLPQQNGPKPVPAVVPFQKGEPPPQATASTPLAAPSRIRNDLGMEFVLIPAGSFSMGSPPQEVGREGGEEPCHQVTITRPFYLQTTEVTKEQWREVMGEDPSYFKGCSGNCPVENLSWQQARKFVAKLNARDKTDRYHLPSEAQWEYACRAGGEKAFGWGQDPSQLGGHGWYLGNADSITHAVAGKVPNAWGLHDMQGNVAEWCADYYQRGYYADSPSQDPPGPPRGMDRVYRGGSVLDEAETLRCAWRGSSRPSVKVIKVGLRVARDLP